MSHTTPATYLIWSIMSCLLGVFLIYHLWKFDKFKCLKLNNGPASGTFKRLMTFTYLLSVPGIITYSVGFTIIKYQEGFTVLPGYGIIPRPWQLWTEEHKAAILPLYLTFTVSWSLEMVTHLEELCFWLFLINSVSMQQNWFRSLYFRTWVIGSIIAVAYMPLVTVMTREDPLKCEAFTFLAGSLGSLSVTLWFMPILWNFRAFIKRLQQSGVDNKTIVRLTSFHELNCVRVVFRFLFTVPLFILAIDGVRPHRHINESAFWTEFLCSVASVGCGLSSALTLIIFFPRSVEAEVRSRSRTRTHEKFNRTRLTRSPSEYALRGVRGTPTNGEGCASPSPSERESTMKLKPASLFTSSDTLSAPSSPRVLLDLDCEYSPVAAAFHKPGGVRSPASPGTPPDAVFAPNRRVASGVVIEGHVVPSRTGTMSSAGGGEECVHPFLQNFTSPIDIMDGTPKRVYVKRQNGSFSV